MHIFIAGVDNLFRRLIHIKLGVNLVRGNIC